MAMLIVTPNYADRHNRNFRWLVRDASHTPTEVPQGFKAVVATGVAFGPSTRFEEDFGCGTVAFAKSVSVSSEDSVLPPKAIELRFNGLAFVDPQGQYVGKCASLVLRTDGSMYAVIAEEKASKSRQKAPARRSGRRAEDRVTA